MAMSNLKKSYLRAGIWTAAGTIGLVGIGLATSFQPKSTAPAPIRDGPLAIKRSPQTANNKGMAVQGSSNLTIGDTARAGSSGDNVISTGQGNTVTTGQGNIVNSGNGNITTFNGVRRIPLSQQEDARQRLHDSGIEYSDDRYDSAITRHEADIVELFTIGGMRLTTPEMYGFVRKNYDPQVAEVLQKVDQSNACPTDLIASGFYLDVNPAESNFVKNVCGNDRVRARLRLSIDRQIALTAQAKEDDRTNMDESKRNIRRCEEESLIFSGSRTIPENVRKSCQNFAVPPREPGFAERLSELRKALETLNGGS